MLEENNYRESKIDSSIPHHPFQGSQFEIGGDPVEQSNEEQTSSHLGRSCSSHQMENFVDQKSNDEYIDQISE